jgi:hypothetical protein
MMEMQLLEMDVQQAERLSQVTLAQLLAVHEQLLVEILLLLELKLEMMEMQLQGMDVAIFVQ